MEGTDVKGKGERIGRFFESVDWKECILVRKKKKIYLAIDIMHLFSSRYNKVRIGNCTI